MASTPILIGVICLIAKAIIGTEVGPDGILQEPWFLVPLGFLLFCLGIISLMFVALISMLKKTQVSN
ncbi:DUF3955 domain-containing protein [Lysinibacillus sp. NPDC059133]|uniref:DUF3955 domain-containing protein n=1 Tax=Lysinibacillus sp. NPDC059133 TaxID=3346737 RepID=UPI0036BA6711